MATLTTQISEVVTAFGICSADAPVAPRALPATPPPVVGLEEETWSGIVAAARSGAHDPLLAASLENGRFFARSVLGRPPRRVEWRGAVKTAFASDLPTDLRVDHVYQVSCKYGSRVLANPGPVALFDRLLADGTRDGGDHWYERVAPEAHQSLWAACSTHLRDAGVTGLPTGVPALTPEQRRQAAKALNPFPEALAPAYAAFCAAVAEGTAAEWRARIDASGPMATRDLLWRMVRISSGIYFLLGASPRGERLWRYRVMSTADWRATWRVEDMRVTPSSARQPQVDWVFRVVGDDDVREVRGHVEVRWSHGKFSGHPEAKVYLDSDLDDLPGYERLGDHTQTTAMRLF